MLVAAFTLALAQAPSGTSPVNPLGTGSWTDPLNLPCSWAGEETPNKAMTGLLLGYLRGYGEAAAATCASSEASCRTVAEWYDQPRLAEKIDQLCRDNPTWKLRHIADQILRDEGVRPSASGQS